MRMIRMMAISGLIAASGLAVHIARAQQMTQKQGLRRTDLQRHDLSIPGREVVQAIVGFEPGVEAPRHNHPGEGIVYVLEGSLEYRLDGKPSVTLKAGEVLFIPAGAIHSAKNVGRGYAKELATYFVQKGKPLLVPAQSIHDPR